MKKCFYFLQNSFHPVCFLHQKMYILIIFSCFFLISCDKQGKLIKLTPKIPPSIEDTYPEKEEDPSEIEETIATDTTELPDTSDATTDDTNVSSEISKKEVLKETPEEAPENEIAKSPEEVREDVSEDTLNIPPEAVNFPNLPRITERPEIVVPAPDLSDPLEIPEPPTPESFVIISSNHDTVPVVVASGFEPGSTVQIYRSRTCQVTAQTGRGEIPEGQNHVEFEAESLTQDGRYNYYADVINPDGVKSRCSYGPVITYILDRLAPEIRPTNPLLDETDEVAQPSVEIIGPPLPEHIPTSPLPDETDEVAQPSVELIGPPLPEHIPTDPLPDETDEVAQPSVELIGPPLPEHIPTSPLPDETDEVAQPSVELIGPPLPEHIPTNPLPDETDAVAQSSVEDTNTLTPLIPATTYPTFSMIGSLVSLEKSPQYSTRLRPIPTNSSYINDMGILSISSVPSVEPVDRDIFMRDQLHPPTSLTVSSTGVTDPYPVVIVDGVSLGNTVILYTDETCTQEVGQGVVEEGKTEIPVSLQVDSDEATYSFYAKVTDLVETSLCSVASATYTLQRSQPPENLALVYPDLRDSSVPPLYTEEHPIVRVSDVQHGQTIQLYHSPDCTGTVLGSAKSVSDQVDIEVTAPFYLGTYRFYAKAVHAWNISDCGKASDFEYILYKEHTRGFNNDCRLSSIGLTRCWGDDRSGQLGLPGMISRWSLRFQELNERLPFIDLGCRNQIGLDQTDSSSCEENNRYWAKAIVPGGDHACSILNTDDGKCWGDNIFGQLGLPPRLVSSLHSPPQQVIDFGCKITVDENGVCPENQKYKIQSIALGDTHTVFLFYSGQVKGVGSNSHRQIGLSQSISYMDDPSYPYWFDLGENRKGVAVVAYGNTTIVVLDNGEEKCFGEDCEQL